MMERALFALAFLAALGCGIVGGIFYGSALQPAEALAFWPRYVQMWTMWNHVRTVAPLLSTALLMAALIFKR
jgi:uncharacterized membrane protein